MYIHVHVMSHHALYHSLNIAIHAYMYSIYRELEGVCICTTCISTCIYTCTCTCIYNRRRSLKGPGSN